MKFEFKEHESEDKGSGKLTNEESARLEKLIANVKPDFENSNPEKNVASKNSNLDFQKPKKSLELLDARSQEVQEIIGRTPHWLVRRGIGVFLGVLILIFLTASVIEYPEIINAPLSLTAINTPKTLESKINGKVIKLFSQDKSRVEQGEVIAWLESTADHAMILKLSDQLDRIHPQLEVNDQVYELSNEVSAYSKLGELQSAFQTFEQSHREYLAYLSGGYYYNRRKILEQEMTFADTLLKKLEIQRQIQDQNYELAEKELKAQQKLSDKGLIAPLDLLNAERNFANLELPIQQTEASIINNRVSKLSKEKEVMDLDRAAKDQKSNFIQALNTFKSAISDWKSKYLLTAPVSGTLTYAGIVQEQQSINSGQAVLYIEPETTNYFGDMRISQASFGKIQEGQRVMIKFSAYPYQEFGSVTGEIEFLSDFPVEDNLFFAKVRFPEGLTTNYGQQLPPANGMSGQAEIITKDMRLLERIYNNLTKELR